RRRDDGDAKALTDLRHPLDPGIDPAAGRGHSTDLADRRIAIEVLERNLDLVEATLILHILIATDVAFGLKDIEDPATDLRGRGTNGRLAAHRSISDAGEHVAERIVH